MTEYLLIAGIVICLLIIVGIVAGTKRFERLLETIELFIARTRLRRERRIARWRERKGF